MVQTMRIQDHLKHQYHSEHTLLLQWLQLQHRLLATICIRQFNSTMGLISITLICLRMGFREGIVDLLIDSHLHQHVHAHKCTNINSLMGLVYLNMYLQLRDQFLLVLSRTVVITNQTM